MSNKSKERVFAGVEQLSLRSLLLGILGSCIITASSMYIALRISALPWPTIFVAVLSMALLKALGKTTLNEINITQTAMSAGAMVAGGLAFTLPGLWITGTWQEVSLSDPKFWSVLAIAMAGMLLGTILTWYLRLRFVVREPLPYPIGTAAAETIVAGDTGGQKSAILFSTMAFSAMFTFLRDSFGWIPSSLISKTLYAGNFYIGIWVSPMAAGIGYMIGTLYTGVWFLGALLSYVIIVPLGTMTGIFSSAADASAFKNTAGIGLMVGTGIGILLSFIFTLIKQNSESKINDNLQRNSDTGRKPIKLNLIAILAAAAAFLLSVLCNIGILPSLLLIAGVFAASAMAASITGQTGINPMEIFGIIVLLAIRLIANVDTVGAFFIAACVAVACGYAGDLLNDYKAGYILGTNPKAQLISQIAGGAAGTLAAAISMFAIINQYGGVGPDKGLAAGQAFAVSQMVSGIGDPTVFIIALAAGIILYLVKIPAMTLGIGMYLPFEISSVVFLGGLIRFITDKAWPKSVDTGNIAASGFLGGEGITGVAIAIFRMVTGS